MRHAVLGQRHDQRGRAGWVRAQQALQAWRQARIDQHNIYGASATGLALAVFGHCDPCPKTATAIGAKEDTRPAVRVLGCQAFRSRKSTKWCQWTIGTHARSPGKPS